MRRAGFVWRLSNGRKVEQVERAWCGKRPHRLKSRKQYQRGSDAAATAFLRQLVETFAEAFEAHGKADALLRRLKNDESRSLPAAQLLEQIVIHHHLGDATVGQAADKTGSADVDLVNLEPKAGRQQHADRSDHAHQLGLVIGGFVKNDGETRTCTNIRRRAPG